MTAGGTGTNPGPRGSDLDSARRVKRLVVERFEAAEWWRGAGIAPYAQGWAVRLSVAIPTGADVPAGVEMLREIDVPEEIEGVPVEVRLVGDITAPPPPA